MTHEPRWHNGGDPDIDPRLWWADCRCGWRYPKGHRGAHRATVQQAVDQHEHEGRSR